MRRIGADRSPSASVWANSDIKPLPGRCDSLAIIERVDDDDRPRIARVELRRDEVSLVGFTRELEADHALVVAENALDFGGGWCARFSLRGLVAPVELPVTVTGARTHTVLGHPPRHEADLQLQPDDATQRDALATLVERLAGPRVEDLGSLRVLVVDDNEMIRDMFAYGVRRYFRQRACNVEVELAPDGQTAWQRLSSDVYDLVLIDHYMPVLPGTSLMARIRAEPHLRGLPIVAVSGGGAGVRSECLAAGADVFLSKPLVFRDLLETLGGLVAAASA
jgi:CheY-like chemotaxis protein